MTSSLPHPFLKAVPANNNANITPISPITTAVLVFLRHLSSPLVLYVEQPKQLYADLQQLIREARPSQPKLIEKQALGPIGWVSFLDTEVIAVALQAEPGNL